MWVKILLHNVHDKVPRCSEKYLCLTHNGKFYMKNIKFIIINQHKNVMSCNPWKMIFTSAKLAPLIVFSPFHLWISLTL
jgi:hypothetical protein